MREVFFSFSPCLNCCPRASFWQVRAVEVGAYDTGVVLVEPSVMTRVRSPSVTFARVWFPAAECSRARRARVDSLPSASLFTFPQNHIYTHRKHGCPRRCSREYLASATRPPRTLWLTRSLSTAGCSFIVILGSPRFRSFARHAHTHSLDARRVSLPATSS